MNKRVLDLLLCFLVSLCAADAAAQCSDPCRPTPLGKVADNTTLRYSDGGGMAPYWSTFMNAVHNWDTELSTQGSSVALTEGSGDWVVSLSDTLPAGVAGETDYNNRTIKIKSSLTANLLRIALHEVGHTLYLNDVYGSTCYNQTAMSAQLEGVADHV